tara:strand:+ start:168 stop:440 length:273 start_codon:yes stop_codon:yes gene_type:complete
MSKDTHKTRLFSYLEEHKTITSLQSIRDLGNTRLAATICLLRKDGYDIDSTFIEVDNRFGSQTHVAKYTYTETNSVKRFANRMLNKAKVL